MLADRKLKVKFVGGPFDGQKVGLRESNMEAVLPYNVEGRKILYAKLDRGADKKQLRYWYVYVDQEVTHARRISRLRKGVLHGTVWT